MDSDTDRDKICCIILNYNDAETAAGLAEELKESRLIDDILLVDNCSTDDSWEKFKKLELGWKKEEKEDKEDILPSLWLMKTAAMAAETRQGLIMPWSIWNRIIL